MRVLTGLRDVDTRDVMAARFDRSGNRRSLPHECALHRRGFVRLVSPVRRSKEPLPGSPASRSKHSHTPDFPSALAPDRRRERSRSHATIARCRPRFARVTTSPTCARATCKASRSIAMSPALGRPGATLERNHADARRREIVTREQREVLPLRRTGLDTAVNGRSRLGIPDAGRRRRGADDAVVEAID